MFETVVRSLIVVEADAPRRPSGLTAEHFAVANQREPEPVRPAGGYGNSGVEDSW